MPMIRLVFAALVLFAASCSAEGADHKFVLVGSTPCEAAIRPAIGIAADMKCEFIRWNLTLDEARGKAFVLDVNYGEGQPNTSGFIGGGQKLSASGKFEVNARGGREVYRLKSAQPPIEVFLVKLNANLFHLAAADGAMMIGTSGWSSTLNRDPILASAAAPTSLLKEAGSSSQVVFHGRTPCREISELAGVSFDADCFKLKWKLTLNRDATSLQPTTFTIESTFARDKPISGRWSIAKNGDAVIYRLTPDASMKPISLLAADNNHVLFLDTAGRALVGNADFSYTLNRRH